MAKNDPKMVEQKPAYKLFFCESAGFKSAGFWANQLFFCAPKSSI